MKYLFYTEIDEVDHIATLKFVSPANRNVRVEVRAARSLMPAVPEMIQCVLRHTGGDLMDTNGVYKAVDCGGGPVDGPHRGEARPGPGALITMDEGLSPLGFERHTQSKAAGLWLVLAGAGAMLAALYVIETVMTYVRLLVWSGGPVI